MQKFTIKDMEHLSGIKAHTLRIWEQRYPFFKAQRKQSQHRFYDNEDLKKLLRIAYLYHSGWKVSKISALSEQSISDLVRNSPITKENYQLIVFKLLEAAADFDEQSFSTVLDDVIENIGFENTVLEVCYPFLQKIGLLWMTSNVIPAQEHFSSYIILHKIISETDKLPAPAGNEAIILFSPDGEHHELPLLFINYLLRRHGWRTIYLGSNVHWTIASALMQKQEVVALYLHVITFLNKWEIEDYLEAICKAFPHKTIVASGAAVQAVHRTFVNLQTLKSDEAIRLFVQRPIALATHR